MLYLCIGAALLMFYELEIIGFLVMIQSLYGQIYFQEFSCSKPELKLPSVSCSPIIDPHLSPDGTMVAYVRDWELHVLDLMHNESIQLTYGANGNTLVCKM